MIPGPSRIVTLASGLRLHARVQGRGPWMVLFNGLLSDTSMWTGVLGGLASRFRVVTFDGRGQGRSDDPSGPFSPAEAAADARELMARLGVERPWLVGLSHGGALVLECLAAEPEAFAGAVLVSTTAHADLVLRLQLDHWRHCLEAEGPVGLFDAAAPSLWGGRFLERRHATLRAWCDAVLGGSGGRISGSASCGEPFEGSRHQIGSAQSWDIRSRLGPAATLAHRILILAGEEDLLTPPWKVRKVAELLPGSRFETVEGIGHAFPVEDPGRFTARVLAFANGAESVDSPGGIPPDRAS